MIAKLFKSQNRWFWHSTQGPVDVKDCICGAFFSPNCPVTDHKIRGNTDLDMRVSSWGDIKRIERSRQNDKFRNNFGGTK